MSPTKAQIFAYFFPFGPQARARLDEKVESYKPCEWVLVIDGPFSEFDKARVEAIAEHLRSVPSAFFELA